MDRNIPDFRVLSALIRFIGSIRVREIQVNDIRVRDFRARVRTRVRLQRQTKK